MNREPFLGVYTTQDGVEIDLYSGEIVPEGTIKSHQQPFYGVFIDKDGIEHPITDIVIDDITEDWSAINKKYNNKQIYRKSFVFTTASSDPGTVQLDFGFKAFDIIRVFGSIRRSNGNIIMIDFTETDYSGLGVDATKIEGYFTNDAITGNTIANIYSDGANFVSLPGSFWIECTKEE